MASFLSMGVIEDLTLRIAYSPLPVTRQISLTGTMSLSIDAMSPSSALLIFRYFPEYVIPVLFLINATVVDETPILQTISMTLNPSDSIFVIASSFSLESLCAGIT